MAAVVSMGLDQSDMEVVDSIRMFDLAKVLRQIPFLTQPSVFIRAWDQHNKTLAWAPLQLRLDKNSWDILQKHFSGH